ncbi:hypothetical protein ACFPN9_21950, partial [Bosea massiliensis]
MNAFALSLLDSRIFEHALRNSQGSEDPSLSGIRTHNSKQCVDRVPEVCGLRCGEPDSANPPRIQARKLHRQISNSPAKFGTRQMQAVSKFRKVPLTYAQFLRQVGLRQSPYPPQSDELVERISVGHCSFVQCIITHITRYEDAIAREQTMQTMHTLVGDRSLVLEMPRPDEWLMPGIRWGRFEELFTAAYWHGQAWQARVHDHYSQLKLGRTLTEEVAACLLGGYGMKAEIGLAAYRRIRDLGMLRPDVGAAALERVLSEPMTVQGRSVRYRFPQQKARYLASCCRFRRDRPGNPIINRPLFRELTGRDSENYPARA